MTVRLCACGCGDPVVRQLDLTAGPRQRSGRTREYAHGSRCRKRAARERQRAGERGLESPAVTQHKGRADATLTTAPPPVATPAGRKPSKRPALEPRDATSRDPFDRFYTDPQLALACARVLPSWFWRRGGLAGRFAADHDGTPLVREQGEEPGRVYEPHVGGGAFALAVAWLRSTGEIPSVDLTVGDLDPGAPGLDYGDRMQLGDFLTGEAPDPRPTAILGNPPFSTELGNAADHVRRALDLVGPSGSVAFLLRLAILETPGRRDLWGRLFGFWPVLQRARFAVPGATAPGAYNHATALFLWGPPTEAPPRMLGFIDWR